MASLRERYARLKPIDIFARDMLAFIRDRLGLKFDLPKVKVLYCDDDLWMALWPISKRTILGSPREYIKRPKTDVEDWRKVNGWVVQPVARNRKGRIGYKLTERRRLNAFTTMGFNGELAGALAQFDAIIFLHTSNLRRAMEHGKPFPAHIVVTHECIHLIERLSGETIIEGFDHEKFFDHPATFSFLAEFLRNVGREELKKRYFIGPSKPSQASFKN